MAAILGVSTTGLAQEQVSSALERGDYKAAVFLLKTYCEKNEESARELVRSLIYLHQYTEAVATATGIPELEQMVRNSVNLKAQELISYMQKNVEIVHEKRTRLEFVQAKKAAMPQLSLNPDSETASQYSLDSKSSNVSSVTKGRAKTLKKLRKSAAKEGSALEEEYLVDLLLTYRPDSALILQVESVQKGLLLVGETDTAVKLAEILRTITKVTDEEFRTTKQSAFLNEFYARFPDVKKDPNAQAGLCDLVTASFFLDSGQASHVRNSGKIRKDLETFLGLLRDRD